VAQHMIKSDDCLAARSAMLRRLESVHLALAERAFALSAR
jgi:hypothetical protein